MNILHSAEERARAGKEITKRDVGLRVGRLAGSCLLRVMFGPQWQELISIPELTRIVEANYLRTKHTVNYDFLMQKRASSEPL